MAILGLQMHRADQFAKIANRHQETHRSASIENFEEEELRTRAGKILDIRDVTVAGFLFTDKGSNEGIFSSSVLESFPCQPGGSFIKVTNLAEKHLQSKLPFIDASKYGHGNIVNGAYLLLAGTVEDGVLHVKQLSDGSTDPLATTAQKIKDWVFGF